MELSLPFPGSSTRSFVSIFVSLREEGEREIGEKAKEAKSAKLSFLRASKLSLNNLEQDKPHCHVPWKAN